jgi:hypothetical protein
VSIVDSNQNAGWERVRQHGSGSPIHVGDLHRPPQPGASEQSKGSRGLATDSKTTKSVKSEKPKIPADLANDEETDSTPVADAGLGDQPRLAGNTSHRKNRELSISRRLVEKRRASERGKFKIQVLYVVGYLFAAIVLSWLIRQTYLAWY